MGINFYYSIASSLGIILFGSFILALIESISSKHQILQELKKLTAQLDKKTGNSSAID
jgi:hypothetical protein